MCRLRYKLDTQPRSKPIDFAAPSVPRKAGLIDDGWQKRLPNNSVPYTSTIVFVVRSGNPKGIKDWPDLVTSGVQIITPNPKTSGNGKLSFLAAWGSVTQRGGSDADALAFVTKLYGQVPVLDTGARGSTVTFVQKQIGDVHLTWENEAYLESQEANGAVDIVYPPISFLAEPPVTWVDGNVKRKNTEAVTKAYLEFLWTPAGQEIIGKNRVLTRYDFPLKSLLDSLIDLPFALPTAVAGLVYSSLYAPNGWLGRYLVPLGIHGAYSRLGIVLVLVFIGFPFVVRTLEPVIANLEADVEEAAACLGADRWQTVWHVIYPRCGRP